MKKTRSFSLFLMMFLITSSHAYTKINAEDLLQQTPALVGKSICVKGTVDHIEKDGLDPKRFIVVLEGPIYCRFALTQFSANGYHCRLHGKGLGPVSLTVSGSKLTSTVGNMAVRENHVQNARILEKGESLTILGTLKPQGSKNFLADPIPKDSDNQTIRLILGLTESP